MTRTQLFLMMFHGLLLTFVAVVVVKRRILNCFRNRGRMAPDVGRQRDRPQLVHPVVGQIDDQGIKKICRVIGNLALPVLRLKLHEVSVINPFLDV